MKKTIALLLSFMLLFTAVSPALAEAPEDDPVVIVPGLMESILVTDRCTP